ncbi:unnamed protein product [Didymodactylos carnosus]|uniref:Uncharacterized protein n=1 Tax=Didymodactylos carnosus TaxID=1234261 RepID=A0A814HTJ6_9BILA|nr:unnamed protein product [Didymodactylos carnosus]CAF1013960.1 unnamed protein product [Didymodactylos carnosus]CAF3604522.1 unnamed protein product [Didymodactylos carnosus]CAF3785426.1 unnamed protein product [Didymodactylos carnosus]
MAIGDRIRSYVDDPNATRPKDFLPEPDPNQYFLYSPEPDPIRSGAVTVGACAYVVSIVWYLAYARHQGFESFQGRRRIQQVVLEQDIRDVQDDTNNEEGENDTDEEGGDDDSD